MATFPDCLKVVPRDQWGAKPPKLVQKFNGPAPYVIIHHSYIPKACYIQENCEKAMRSMQRFHQDDRGWNDIGYSFAIGGDGNIYEGRGFNVVGAHTIGYNNKSVGICLIGDWRKELPPQEMLDAVNDLIDFAYENKYITEDYKLIGHRQASATECPGQKLFMNIKSWPHFSPSPTTESTLINEIPNWRTLAEPLFMISREEWGAKSAKEVHFFNGPAPYVIILHSYIPSACYTEESCSRAMRTMQRYHQEDKDWLDIGYSFAIGGDGNIYEGRGFNVIGAHSRGYNDKSVGICLIGDWTDQTPPENMIDVVKELITIGLSNDSIDKNYKLIGYRNATKGLFNEIKSWPHYRS